MSETTIQVVTKNLQHNNFVPPVSERQLGWNAYAAGLPVETCGTDAMRRGWLAANRAQAYAETVAVYGEVAA